MAPQSQCVANGRLNNPQSGHCFSRSGRSVPLAIEAAVCENVNDVDPGRHTAAFTQHEKCTISGGIIDFTTTPKFHAKKAPTNHASAATDRPCVRCPSPGITRLASAAITFPAPPTAAMRRPHCGHAAAVSDTSRPQSGQWIRAIAGQIRRSARSSQRFCGAWA